MFLQRTLRVPGLAHIPTHLIIADKEKASRAQSREKQVAKTNNQRRPDLYENGQKVVLQNNVSKLWNIRGTIVSRRTHQGLPTNSYIVKSSQTGRHI